MATIGKIRKHSTLLLILVGGALALFVLSDFLGSRGGGRRQKQIDVAVINGEKIHPSDFYSKLDEQIEMYKLQYGDNMTSNVVFQVREEVLNELIKQTILHEQYKKSGIMVSQAEMVDMMTGVNIHPIIRQNFVDPQTGQFNPNAVTNYLLRLDSLEQKHQNQWFTLEKVMKNERYFEKYQNLIKKSYFFPKAMATTNYKKQGQMASVKIVSLKYNDIPDEEITLTDKDFEKFYAERKHEYEQEESRQIDFVIFDILPSDTDLAEGRIAIGKLYEDFEKIPFENRFENFNFVNLKSDLEFNPDTNYIKRVELPAQADTLFDLPIGSMIGPYNESNTYYITKLLDRSLRADSMKASHILIAFRGSMRAEPSVTRTKEEAEAKADSLLAVVRGKDSLFFATKAIEFSDDQSAQMNGGYLDWFMDGQMVTEFGDACQNAKVGDYFVVESPFGFHIVHLKGKKAIEPKVKVAMLQYTISASTETQQRIYTEASKFAGDNKTPETFRSAAEENGYVIRTSDYVRHTDYSIPGVMEGRDIVRWCFDESVESGTVSTVFELIGEDKNVVVLVKLVRKKGIAPLKDLKELIEPLVRREKKAEIQMEKINKAKSGAGSIDEIARKLNTEVIEVEFVSMGSPNVPQIGPEPKLVGTIFGSEKGKISRTVKGESGVYVVSVTEVTETPEPEDYNFYITNQRNQVANRANFEVYNSLQRKADIKDNRIKFY